MNAVELCNRCRSTGVLYLCNDADCHQNYCCASSYHRVDQVPCPSCHGAGYRPVTPPTNGTRSTRKGLYP